MAFPGGYPFEDNEFMVVQDKLDTIIAELQLIKVILSRHMAGLVCSKDTEVHLPTNATHFKGVQHYAIFVPSRIQALHWG